MQLVLLAGELGEKYGQQHEYYNLHTPADAIKLLCFNYPALQQELVTAHHNGVGYKVIQGGAAMGYEELHLPFGSRPLLVVPVVTGAGGGGTSQILLGVGLVAAAIVFAPAGAGFLAAGLGVGASTTATFSLAAGAYIASTSAVLLGGVSTAIGAIGAGLILSGTANLISPQPELRNPSFGRIKGEGTNVRGSGPDGITRGGLGQQNYAFTGPVNTVGTGATLPVIYGRVITGSHLIAASLEVSDDSDPLRIATQRPGEKTLKINSERLTTELQDCGGVDSRRGGSKNELIVNSKDANTKKKVKIDKQFGPGADDDAELKEEESISFSQRGEALKYKHDKDKQPHKKLDIIFALNNGLFDYVAAEGTTKIDGFITYEITVTVTQSGDDVDVARAQITVQGLLNSEDQEVVFGNRLEMPKVKGAEGANERVYVKVEIIEAEVYDGTTFKLQGYGYDLL
nr:phage HK022 GP20-like protein [uncultured Mediterranean phage uvMED]